MRRLPVALVPVGLALALVSEWYGRPDLLVLDLIVGLALVGCGLAAWSLRSQSHAGPIMAAAGAAWFVGSFGGWFVYLHRGVLAHLLLSYPTGRVSSRLERVAVAAAYAYAIVYPVADNDYATIVFGVGLAATALYRYVDSSGPQQRARASALAAATAFGLVLVVESGNRLGDVGTTMTQLWIYELTVGLVALGLFADLMWGRWTRAAVTGLVVDLGEQGTAGTLRDNLARALGDPSLVVGYALEETDGYVDEAGRAVELPPPGAEREVTPIDQDGRRIAILVHDPSVLNEPQLVASVAAAAGIAVANVRLQAELRSRVAEVESSRRRIVEAADAQRSRLEEEIRQGPEHRLVRVGSLVSGADDELERQVDAARTALREFARGVHPRTLTEHGLQAALDELAARSPVPVNVSAPARRLAREVEATVYFVCSEALTNVAKHAHARSADVRVEATGELVEAEVSDDGVGAADVAGSGLRGLADRVDALGGWLEVDSPPGIGTRLRVRIPLD
jgi:signal transduction histidine kinase